MLIETTIYSVSLKEKKKGTSNRETKQKRDINKKKKKHSIWHGSKSVSNSSAAKIRKEKKKICAIFCAQLPQF